MKRALNKLSVVSARAAPPGKYSDGGGLWLYKRPDGGAQWVLRVTVHGRRREMGLGAAALGQRKNEAGITLANAREAATEYRSLAKSGVDPIKHRAKLAREAEQQLHILNDVARDCFESRKAELKGDGKTGRWFTPLELHVLPKLGKVPVAELDQRDIRDVLAPIWHDKPATAAKAVDRLNLVIRHAAALGLDVDLQAVAKAKALLGRQRHKPKPTPSLPWYDVPEFYASLDQPSSTHLALRLLILTGLRSAPVRSARYDQIEGDVWTIPGRLMKSRVGDEQDFNVPLSSEAMRVIDLARPLEHDGLIFPSPRNLVMSDMTLSRFMERRGLDARPHGFRSSLRTWLAEATDAPHEVAESVLAHATDSKVVRAYRRTDYLEQRRVLMERWGAFVGGQSGDVVQMVHA